MIIGIILVGVLLSDEQSAVVPNSLYASGLFEWIDLWNAVLIVEIGVGEVYVVGTFQLVLFLSELFVFGVYD